MARERTPHELHDTLALALDFQEDRPRNKLKNDSFSPRNGPQDDRYCAKQVSPMRVVLLSH